MSDEAVKLRIVSDGTGRGTRVETEDGVLIRGVQSVEWRVDEPGGLATATLRVVRVAVNVVGELEREE